MTNAPTPDSPAKPDRTLRDLDLGCRIGFLVLTIFFGLVVFRMAWPLSNGELLGIVFANLLKGESLPLGLKIAFAIQPALLALSVALPVAALLAAFWVRRPLTAILVISGCNLLLAMISLFLWFAVIGSFGAIIRSMI